jgi:hypothetical protein
VKQLKWIIVCCALSSCKPQLATNSDAASTSGELPTPRFAPVPGECSKERSTKTYCDGYWMRNTSESALPVFLENRSSSWPNQLALARNSKPSSTLAALYLISGKFDFQKPTVIFFHGWMGDVPQGTSVGFPDIWRDQAMAAGFNVAIFDWHKLSWDDGKGCPGLASIGIMNAPCNASYNLFKKDGAGDIFLREYADSKLFPNTYKQEVRFVGHSLGSVLALSVGYRLNVGEQFGAFAKPSRIDLIDPAFALGMTSDRTTPFGRQIPSDELLPPDYRNSVVKDFVSKSACHSDSLPLRPANHLSQYCQAEGMAYILVKNHSVAIAKFSSIVGRLTSMDFTKVVHYQAFNPLAFRADANSRHGTPLASYWFSFAPGEPKGAFDASSNSKDVLKTCRDRLNGKRFSLMQTAGFNTIDMQDDDYRPIPML